jgi:hypothetical protein
MGFVQTFRLFFLFSSTRNMNLFLFWFDLVWSVLFCDGVESVFSFVWQIRNNIFGIWTHNQSMVFDTEKYTLYSWRILWRKCRCLSRQNLFCVNKNNWIATLHKPKYWLEKITKSSFIER